MTQIIIMIMIIHEETDNVLDRIKELNEQLQEAEEQEKQWTVSEEDIKSGVLKEDDMKEIFDEFDVDGGGSIDADELQDALTKMGINKTMDEVNELIEEIDEDENGEVDFDEFKVMVGQTWFINAYETKLVGALETMMSNLTVLDDDGDDDDSYDEKDGYDSDNYKGKNESELMDEIKKKLAIISELKKENDKLKSGGVGLQTPVITGKDKGHVEENSSYGLLASQDQQGNVVSGGNEIVSEKK
eukprot:308800_1